MKRLTLLLAGAALLSPVYAQREEVRRASMRGGGGDHGKCTIEVEVDDIAEVFISGDTARLRTLSGKPAFFRRFECNSVMPPNPGDFRFSGIDGRGRQTLVRDPRENRGIAVVRIDDNRGGREGYTFDIEWRGAGGYGGGGGYSGGAGGPWRGNNGPAQAISTCQDAVRAKADREYGYRDVNFLQAAFDNNRGRRDWIAGVFEGRRGNSREQFQFSCSVDFDAGRVRSVDITRSGGGVGSGYAGDPIRACESAAANRLQNDGYTNIAFRGTNLDSRRGDTVVGNASARDRYGSSNFDFSCSIDARGGVRNVDVVRR